MTKDAEKRPKLEEIVEDEWINIDCEATLASEM